VTGPVPVTLVELRTRSTNFGVNGMGNSLQNKTRSP
jgi:hypothetical protein